MKCESELYPSKTTTVLRVLAKLPIAYNFSSSMPPPKTTKATVRMPTMRIEIHIHLPNKQSSDFGQGLGLISVVYPFNQ